MKTFYTLLLILIAFTSNAQQIVSGTVLDEKSKPIAGANIFIDGTYDGSSTDENGNFKFTTTAKGNQILVISFLTYETLKAKIDSLPQAILHKAFKGELTEQLDSDGDARELLKEIEGLKQVQQDKGKKGKSNTTKSVAKKVKSYVEKDEVLGMVAETKEELQPKVVKLKPTNTEIYKRTLLAAEIVYQLKDTNTLGHLKLQKMLYLCQEIGNMNLPMNFLKQAMGPYDNQLARSLDKQFVIKKWFEYQNGALLKYKPLESCGKHKDDFFKFFENEIEQINYIINKFTKFTSNQIEAVATLYACWKEAIDKKELITDRLIIAKFYQWSKEKEKFREENLIKALAWMRRNGVYPNF